MKRGKEEEKAVGPMFPRLHVNDTAEKGGPRAPPRNKMALYEQLSIPSQRFGSALNPTLPSPASSSQGSGVERNLGIPRQLPHWSPMPRPEKLRGHNSDGTNGAATAHLEQRQKVREENEFTVPGYGESKMGQCYGNSQQSMDRQAVSSISSGCSGQPGERRNASDQAPKHNESSTDGGFRQEVRNQSKGSVMASGENGNRAAVAAMSRSTRENVDGRAREAASDHERRRVCPVSNFSRSCEGEDCLNRASRGGNLIESVQNNRRNESRCGEGGGRPKKPENDGERNGDFHMTCVSLQLKRVDKGDDVFETSMVESISGVDIAPDDVVGIIGQKHFWKARKAIVNQQRVFTAQVFELHKLIQVQRLIAESPHLLFDGAFFEKSSFKCSPGKNLPVEFVVKSLPVVVHCKDNSEKPKHKNECSAENMVAKTSLSPIKHGSQSTNYGPHMGHTQPAVATTDNKAGPWCFPQPPGPQWLVPVMSPSEGLVYKPYPGPVPGAVYGGFGPFGSTPTTGNYTNSPNGVPASHPQGIGSFPGTPPVGHPYFPYGMPVANPAMSGSVGEQGIPFVGPGSHSQTSPKPGASLNMEQQSSCNVPPTQKNGSITQLSKFRASRCSDLQQGSTASSPGERANGVGISRNSGGRDPLPLFPTAPVASEGASQSHDADKPARVIKVVPHNPRSATESAARIFRFIQEERKQHNFV